MKQLYQWTKHWAETPYGLAALAVLAFIESSFFPVPPDILLIALVMLKPSAWWRFALTCTAASVVGEIGRASCRERG